MPRVHRIWIFCLTALLATSGVSRAHTQIEPGFNLFSTAQDVQIGQQSARDVERRLPMLNDARANSLVQRLGARLAAHSSSPFTYHFKVVNLGDLNAFSLPGGWVYVNRGLVEKVRTEGELAGVMSHEIAHVALRHGTHQITQAYAAQAGLGLLESLLLGHSGNTTRSVLETVGGVGLNTLFLKFSRSAEAEADAYGARIMARSGYSPNDMANFFHFMNQQAASSPSRVAAFLSDHPAPASRETHIRNEARSITVARQPAIGGLAAAQTSLRRLPPAPVNGQLAAR